MRHRYFHLQHSLPPQMGMVTMTATRTSLHSLTRWCRAPHRCWLQRRPRLQRRCQPRRRQTVIGCREPETLRAAVSLFHAAEGEECLKGDCSKPGGQERRRHQCGAVKEAKGCGYDTEAPGREAAQALRASDGHNPVRHGKATRATRRHRAPNVCELRRRGAGAVRFLWLLSIRPGRCIRSSRPGLSLQLTLGS
jgi:hypothetical protein